MSALTTKSKRKCEHGQCVTIYDCSMELKDRLTQARLEAGLSQSALARRCVVDPSVINHIESGRTKTLSGELLLNIARALNVEARWLADEKGPKNRGSPVIPEQDCDFTDTEIQAIKNLRELSPEDAQAFYLQIARMAMLVRANRAAAKLSPKRGKASGE